MIGKCAAENGNAATIKRFKASHNVGEGTVRLFKKRYQPQYKNHAVGVVKHSIYKTQLLNLQSTLKTPKCNHFTMHLKPGLQYIIYMHNIASELCVTEKKKK